MRADIQWPFLDYHGHTIYHRKQNKRKKPLSLAVEKTLEPNQTVSNWLINCHNRPRNEEPREDRDITRRIRRRSGKVILLVQGGDVERNIPWLSAKGKTEREEEVIRKDVTPYIKNIRNRW